MRLLDALNRTCPPCSVRVMTEDQWYASRTFVLPQDDFVTGIATSYRADGSQLKYRFYSVPDQAAFDRFVRGELARRGANTVVSGDGHRLTLTTSGLVAHEQPNAPKGLKIKWNDLHVAWHDGVLVWGGSPDIKAVDATSVRKIIRRARGASNMFVVFPAQIPASAKQVLLASWKAWLLTHAQARDDDPEAIVGLRSAWGHLLAACVDSGFNEVTEVTIRHSMPEEGQPARISATLSCRQDSNLAKLLAEIRPSAGGRLQKIDQYPVNCEINFRVPKDLREPLRQAVSVFGSVSPELVSWCGKQLEEPQVNLASFFDPNTAPGSIVVSMQTADAETDDKRLSALFRRLVASADGPLLAEKLSPFLSHQLLNGINFSVQESELVAEIPLSMDQPSASAAPTHGLTRGRSTDNGTLLRISADVGKLLTESERSTGVSFLTGLEHLYQQFVIHRLSPGARDYYFGRGRIAELPLRSLTSHISGDEGDYTCEARVSISRNGNQLTVDAVLGSDLYWLLLARRTLTQQQLSIGTR